jgi:hypothetical protein
MQTRFPQSLMLLLLSAAIGAGPDWSSVVSRDLPAIAETAEETVEDSLDAESKSLEGVAELPLDQRQRTTHCQEAVPDAAADAAEHLLVNDHAARGPPTV